MLNSVKEWVLSLQFWWLNRVQFTCVNNAKPHGVCGACMLSSTKKLHLYLPGCGTDDVLKHSDHSLFGKHSLCSCEICNLCHMFNCLLTVSQSLTALHTNTITSFLLSNVIDFLLYWLKRVLCRLPSVLRFVDGIEAESHSTSAPKFDFSPSATKSFLPSPESSTSGQVNTHTHTHTHTHTLVLFKKSST